MAFKGKLCASQLRDRIIIQSPVVTKDAFGQPIINWVEHAGIWANVLFQNGKEFINSNKELASITASIRIRYRLDITSEMRVLFRDYIFNIQAVLPDSNRKHIDLAVITGVNNG